MTEVEVGGQSTTSNNNQRTFDSHSGVDNKNRSDFSLMFAVNAVPVHSEFKNSCWFLPYLVRHFRFCTTSRSGLVGRTHPPNIDPKIFESTIHQRVHGTLVGLERVMYLLIAHPFNKSRMRGVVTEYLDSFEQ